jgi:uncharacterized protein YaeQ
MALPATIYRTSIELSDIDRGNYEHLQTTVARHPSETAERLVGRLLAFALFHEEDLVFTKGISAGDEPDMWTRGADGRVRLWVEVGLPETERLIKASRHAERVALLAIGAGRLRWESAHLPRLTPHPNIAVYALDHGFIQQLSGNLQRSISWSLTRSGATLYLSSEGATLEAPLIILKEPA